MDINHTMDFLDPIDEDDFGEWCFEVEEDNSFDEKESYNEDDEIEYYFEGDNMFFCPCCDKEYTLFESMKECFEHCQKEKQQRFKELETMEKCPICNGSGLTTGSVEYPDGEGGVDIVQETVICKCQ